MKWVLMFEVLFILLCMYLIYRIGKVSKKQQELTKFVFDRSQDREWDFESYGRRLRWFNRDCSFNYMLFTFWVWPLDRLVRGVYRDDFLEWKRHRIVIEP